MDTIWANKQQREEFFTKLRAVLDEYPNISQRMIHSYQDDPTHACWDHGAEGYVAFDPSSPMFLQGVVLIVTHANLEHYEDLDVLAPYEQSNFMTLGLLTKACSIFGIEGEING